MKQRGREDVKSIEARSAFQCTSTNYCVLKFLLRYALQAAVRKACNQCTVVTIAHRLNTIMDYDKVVVMGAGKVLEYGSPQALMEKKDSNFSELLRASRVNRVPSREFAKEAVAAAAADVTG